MEARVDACSIFPFCRIALPCYFLKNPEDKELALCYGTIIPPSRPLRCSVSKGMRGQWSKLLLIRNAIN